MALSVHRAIMYALHIWTISFKHTVQFGNWGGALVLMRSHLGRKWEAACSGWAQWRHLTSECQLLSWKGRDSVSLPTVNTLWLTFHMRPRPPLPPPPPHGIDLDRFYHGMTLLLCFSLAERNTPCNVQRHNKVGHLPAATVLVQAVVESLLVVSTNSAVSKPSAHSS